MGFRLGGIFIWNKGASYLTGSWVASVLYNQITLSLSLSLSHTAEQVMQEEPHCV
jgi:hypothetical protein